MAQILIVDDNPNNLYLVRFLLEHEGFNVDEVYDGQQAVNAAAAKIYDLILMDVQMPVMDGLTATRLIKEKNPLMKVVAITARVMKDDQKNILEAGCDGYIEKPIDVESFAEKIKTYL